jgi:hypothetical protein
MMEHGDPDGGLLRQFHDAKDGTVHTMQGHRYTRCGMDEGIRVHLARKEQLILLIP